MGNNFSNKSDVDNNLKPLSQGRMLDYIATHYILTMDFKSLKNLYKPEYCDKLIILTSKIIDRYFTNLEIKYLVQRIKQGEPVNIEEQDSVVYFNKDTLLDLNVKNKFKKKNMCISISKFYVKIAHLFAAIVMTINPTYVYKNEDGETVRADLYEKDKIPPNVPRNIYKFNICDNRINMLQYKNKNKNIDTESQTQILHPNVCSMNVSNSGGVKTLYDEVGIPQLRELYNDDKYNYTTGKFDSMTKETEQLFKDDLGIFYETFTGKTKQEIPASIKDFNDIQLKDYNQQCKTDAERFKAVKVDNNESLFVEYADHLSEMIRTAKNNQHALLDIIDELFVYTIDPQTNKKQIRINPSLTEESLQKVVVDTRSIIIKLYLQCEMNFTTGMNIYEAIVLQKSLDTSLSQTKTLEQEKNKLLNL